jgi:hypothetical protein
MENGMPIEGQSLPDDGNAVDGGQGEPLDDAFIDRALGRNRIDEDTGDEPPPE